MSIKTILAVIAEAAGENDALEAALQLTRSHEAHLRIVHLMSAPPQAAEDAADPAAPGSIAPDVLMDQVSERIHDVRRRTAARVARFGYQLAKFPDGTPAREAIGFRSLIGTPHDCLPLQAKTVDITVTGGDHEAKLLPALLFNTGCPVLMIPEVAASGWSHGTAKTAAIFWDGSVCAARAVRAAMPLLAGCIVCHVLSIARDGSVPGQSSEADLLGYLRDHRVEVDCLHPPREFHTVGETLLSRATMLGADLVVMGAYGAGGLADMGPDGITRYMLGHAAVPLLLAH